MIKVAVLSGGSSNERDISLLSGANVAKALKTRGYVVSELDPKDGIDSMLTDLRAVDVVFPVLHGSGGEDGFLQKVLEEQKIVFIGSGSEASKLCFNKDSYIKFLEKNDINVPETQLVDIDQFKTSSLTKRPFVLKPNEGGSSIDSLVIHDPSRVSDNKIDMLFDKYHQMLLEPLVSGVEVTVGILLDKALPLVEIIPPSGQEFDYTNKYNGQSQELCPPAHVSDRVQEQAQSLALKIHNLCGCRDMSRTDIIIDSNEKLFVLETNTIPGLTEQSLLPKAALSLGIDMPTLVDTLVQAALSRSN